MAHIPGKIVVGSEVAIQTRRAQAVDPRLAAEIRRVCEACACIAACYLLDARRPATGETALLIATTLDGGSADMDAVAQQFQAMLRQFPAQAARTYIMSSAGFVATYAGSEFYVRRSS
ncbi:MAG: hypothetical protein AB1813_19715 [Verrucomicrobiota bacterium]